MFKSGLTSLVLVVLLLASCKSDPSADASKNASTTPAADTASNGMPKRLPNAWKDKVCDLVTDQEFYTLFNVEEKRDFANKRSLVTNGGYCLRTWKKTDWREREARQMNDSNVATSPESALALEILDYGTEVASAAQFESFKKNRVNGYATDVPGVGEAALWSDEALMLIAKKGHLCVQIKLDHADTPGGNLPLAKEVALIALKKM